MAEKKKRAPNFEYISNKDLREARTIRYFIKAAKGDITQLPYGKASRENLNRWLNESSKVKHPHATGLTLALTMAHGEYRRLGQAKSWEEIDAILTLALNKRNITGGTLWDFVNEPFKTTADADTNMILQHYDSLTGEAIYKVKDDIANIFNRRLLI